MKCNQTFFAPHHQNPPETLINTPADAGAEAMLYGCVR
jgi:hypothetical protein